METLPLREGETYIKLSQALKKLSLVDSGAEAKMRVRMGEIFVNQEAEDRPGRKLVAGDVLSFQGKEYRVH